MKKTILLFAIVGVSIASIAVFVGIKHNSMGEFCIGNDLDNCRIDWLYASQLWFFWFTPIFLIQTGVLFSVKRLIIYIKNIKKAEQELANPLRSFASLLAAAFAAK